MRMFVVGGVSTLIIKLNITTSQVFDSLWVYEMIILWTLVQEIYTMPTMLCHDAHAISCSNSLAVFMYRGRRCAFYSFFGLDLRVCFVRWRVTKMPNFKQVVLKQWKLGYLTLFRLASKCYRNRGKQTRQRSVRDCKAAEASADFHRIKCKTTKPVKTTTKRKRSAVIYLLTNKFLLTKGRRSYQDRLSHAFTRISGRATADTLTSLSMRSCVQVLNEC